MKRIAYMLGALVTLWGCQSGGPAEDEETNMSTTQVPDPHTFAKPEEAVVKHLDWTATVNFEEKVIDGVARLTIERSPEAETLILDSKGLQISRVTIGPANAEEETEFSLGAVIRVALT